MISIIKARHQGYAVKINKVDEAADIRYFILKDNAVMPPLDVQEYFPDSEDVNNTLRTLIILILKKYKLK